MQAPVQENAPEPVFHDNPLSGSDAPRERPQTYSSPMKPMLPSSATGHSQAGYGDNDNELVPSTGASAGQTYTPPARESVTAANADVDQEVFANKAVEPESDALSTAAQADSGQEFTPQQTPQTGLSDQPIAPEGRGTYIEEEVAREVPGQVTSTPQLGREVVSHHLAEDESNIPAQDNTAVSQHVDVSEPVLVEEPVVADIAREVPIESAPQQTEFGEHLRPLYLRDKFACNSTSRE